MINVNALYIALVDPDTVTIRSGQDPSDMLIFAPDCRRIKIDNQLSKLERNLILYGEGEVYGTDEKN